MSVRVLDKGPSEVADGLKTEGPNTCQVLMIGDSQTDFIIVKAHRYPGHVYEIGPSGFWANTSSAKSSSS